MLAALSMACFLLGFIFHGSGTVTSLWLDPTSMLLLGLALLAAHLAGAGTWIKR